MVFKNNKWVCNKDETINDLADGKYFILDKLHHQQMENDSNIKICMILISAMKKW